MGKPKPEITDKERAEILRWLVNQHNEDYKQCPTEIMTHSYVLKLADSLDEKAGKTK